MAVAQDNHSTTTLRSHYRGFLVCMLLGVAIFAVYWQVGQHSFIIYDDPLYVTDNLHVQKGFNLTNLGWAFANTDAANWHPVTWISHMLDVQLFGLNAGGHHLINVLLHSINSIFLFTLLLKWTGRFWSCWVIALIFAMHPLHVESVAWISERKDVLFAFFWLATLYFYTRYTEDNSTRHYLLAIIFFLFGIMSKSMIVTLPIIFFLVDYWPLNRIGNPAEQSGFILVNQSILLKRLFLEKVPFLIGSLIIGLVTIEAQKSGGAVGSLETYSCYIRLGNALVAYCKYMIQTIWPLNLAVFYPHPSSLPMGQVIASLTVLILITVSVIVSRQNRPWLLVGWFWFLITLLPVIGLIQVGQQALADRYMYIPIIGLLLIIVWGMEDIFTYLTQNKQILFIIVPLAIIGLAAVSWLQLSHWRSSVALFKRSIEVAGENQYACNALGNALTLQGDIEQAIVKYRRALEIDPDYAKAHYNLGHAMDVTGRPKKAIQHLRRAIDLKPDYAAAHNYLGYLLTRSGADMEAITHFLKALESKPNFSAAHLNLGNAYARRDNFNIAMQHYYQAIRFNPRFIEAYTQLGIALIQVGRRDDAAACFRTALKLTPGDKKVIQYLKQILSTKSSRNENLSMDP